MDLDQLDRDLEAFTFSSESDYEVSLAIFHAHHGLPTPVSGDKKHSDPERAQARRKEAAQRMTIWK